jgi:hypothetical protein
MPIHRPPPHASPSSFQAAAMARMVPQEVPTTLALVGVANANRGGEVLAILGSDGWRSARVERRSP